MVHKEGWKYIYSDELKMDVAFHLKTGWAYTKDGVKYSPEELQILDASGGITLQQHLVKKQFGGTIERPKNRPEATGTGSPNTNTERKSKTIDRVGSKHIPEPSPAVFQEQENNLELY